MEDRRFNSKEWIFIYEKCAKLQILEKNNHYPINKGLVSLLILILYIIIHDKKIYYKN